MFNNIKDIKDLYEYLINDDFTYRHYANGSPNNNDIFPYSKIIWGCGIVEPDIVISESLSTAQTF